MKRQINISYYRNHFYELYIYTLHILSIYALTFFYVNVQNFMAYIKIICYEIVYLKKFEMKVGYCVSSLLRMEFFFVKNLVD